MPLTPTHRDHLRGSGLSDETLTASGIRSIAAGESQGFGYPAGLSGILIPYPNTEVRIGGRALPYTRLRVDPQCRRAEGRKYENPLKERLEDGLPYYPYVPEPVAALRRTDTPVFLTEGEKKALALTQEGFPTIGLPGVFMFSDPRSTRKPANKPLHPSLKRWRWRKRTVFLVFDSDRTEKDSVALAHERLCRKLTEAGALVRVVEVPALPGLGKTGADDFLVRRGREALGELVEASRPWRPWTYLVELVPEGLSPEALRTALGDVKTRLAGASREEREAFADAVQERFPGIETEQAEALVKDPGAVAGIVVNGRQLREVVADAWRALKGSEHGDRLFRYGEALVYATDGLQTVDLNLLSWMLNRSADWLRVNKDGQPCDTRLPQDVPKDMLAAPDTRVRPLDGVVHVPVLGMSGEVADDHYDARSRLLQVVDEEILKLAASCPADRTQRSGSRRLPTCGSRCSATSPSPGRATGPTRWRPCCCLWSALHRRPHAAAPDRGAV